MKKIVVCFSLLFSMVFGQIYAQKVMKVYNTDGTIYTYSLSDLDSCNFSAQMVNMLLYQRATHTNLAVSGIDSITFGEAIPIDSSDIYVYYEGDTARVVHYISSDKFVVTISGADVSITTSAGIADLKYYLNGTTSNGSFTLESDAKFTTILNGVNITSASKVPLNLTKKVNRNIIIANGTTNTLTDNSASVGKAVVNTKGATTIKGAGSLFVNANKKNGISSDYDITIESGTITINNTADASKGIKSDASIYVKGGNITVNPSGTLTMEAIGNGYDLSYCSGITADGNIEVSGGAVTITIPSSNAAGRGLSADGHITITDGTIAITSNATAGTYLDTTGTTDSYKSSCIKADSNIILLGGTLTLKATGTAGKCVNADGAIYIGTATNSADNLTLNMSTTGAKLYVSGSGQNADYSNPKALKAEENLYVYGGNINVSTTQDGGEGLESKDTVFIKGGTIVLNTYDDAINATNHVQIDGGQLYAYSSGNDAIDANGTMTITGGLVVAAGQTAPECSFDCDNNTFKITGGILVGIGGSPSTPTANVCTQRSLIYNGITSGTALQIVNSSNAELLTFQVPVYSNANGGGSRPGGGRPGGGSSQLTLLFSSPNLTTGTIAVKQGGSISGGTNFHGYYTGATYSGSTSSTNVTISSMVTTYGSGGGPF
ncbi:MAG: carbohydrate-binding domain-containing protein [Bacteroidales bacterium]|nr:carbohydrate-binding domain-containing protein [Bacteroidales bacterium]